MAEPQPQVNQALIKGAQQILGREVNNDLLPLLKQAGLLIGLAVAIAVGVSVALWTQEPNYQQLYGALSQKDASEVVAAIRASGIKYKVDGTSGAVMVPAEKVNEIRMRLASQGLPKGNAVGLEVLQADQSLSTSQFIEKARYNHAIEEELSRTISSIGVIESARVHLALPKQSIFVRKNTQPSASVMVRLYPGRVLERGQVAAIVHIVASSVPKLTAAMVTVVDQHGALLSNTQNDGSMGGSNKAFEYTRKLERHYQSQILDLLEPMVGVGKVKAQVSAEIDFTQVDSAKESYDPEKKVIRSEQINENERSSGPEASGIPGALSNQPPGEGTTNKPKEGEAPQLAKNQSRSAVKNYEIDKTISHTIKQSGELRRLSVAIVVDNPTTIDEEGKVTVVPFPDEQLLQMKNIIKNAIGFVEERGDKINVMNASFIIPKIEDLPEIPIWEQPWLQGLVKQVLGGIFVIIILLMIVRPLIKALTSRTLLVDDEGNAVDSSGNLVESTSTSGEGEGQPLLVNNSNHSELNNLLATTANSSYEDKLEFARLMIQDDPSRVANVVKEWVANNG